MRRNPVPPPFTALAMHLWWVHLLALRRVMVVEVEGVCVGGSLMAWAESRTVPFPFCWRWVLLWCLFPDTFPVYRWGSAWVKVRDFGWLEAAYRRGPRVAVLGFRFLFGVAASPVSYTPEWGCSSLRFCGAYPCTSNGLRW